MFDKKQELLSFGEHLASSHFVLFVLVLCLIPNVACISKPEADWPYIWAMSGAHIDNILMNNGRSDRSQMLRPTGFKTQSASVMDCQFLIVHSLVLPCELRKNIFIYLYWNRLAVVSRRRISSFSTIWQKDKCEFISNYKRRYVYLFFFIWTVINWFTTFLYDPYATCIVLFISKCNLFFERGVILFNMDLQAAGRQLTIRRSLKKNPKKSHKNRGLTQIFPISSNEHVYNCI